MSDGKKGGFLLRKTGVISKKMGSIKTLPPALPVPRSLLSSIALAKGDGEGGCTLRSSGKPQ